MRVGLIDVDGHTNRWKVRFPNIPLMKLSQYHKRNGDTVEWYNPLTSGHMDIVYQSKVFSYSEDYSYIIDADEVIQGGTGYCIHLEGGVEVFDKSMDKNLPDEIEHIYPDYSLYEVTDTAYGFLTRGCPRGCAFCHVGSKEGRKSYQVAELSEFWGGQKIINLLDPNITASKECNKLFDELIETGARIDFSQGLDIRFMDSEKAKRLKKMNISQIHFAWDNYEDKDIIVPRLKEFKDIIGLDRGSLQVYVLTNFNTTMEEDLERAYILRDMGYAPYITIYNKDSLPQGHPLLKMQRYVNNRWVFYAVERFEDYKRIKEDVQLDGQIGFNLKEEENG